jgi:hypothetical protein
MIETEQNKLSVMAEATGNFQFSISLITISAITIIDSTLNAQFLWKLICLNDRTIARLAFNVLLKKYFFLIVPEVKWMQVHYSRRKFCKLNLPSKSRHFCFFFWRQSLKYFGASLEPLQLEMSFAAPTNFLLRKQI